VALLNASGAHWASGQVVKQVMDLVFLAGGIPNGFWFIDDDGNWIQRLR
jgi:hypothetical protein